MELEYLFWKEKSMILVKVFYEPESKSIEVLDALAYNTKHAVDLTPIFQEHPFYQLIESINWEEVYSQKIHQDE